MANRSHSFVDRCPIGNVESEPARDAASFLDEFCCSFGSFRMQVVYGDSDSSRR
jgi:hypothetical protein